MQVFKTLAGGMAHPDLLTPPDSFEDAGVLRLDAERALVLTTDFFPPVVDDPRWFGRIAAANALSDVFAMGGDAVGVLNLLCWPDALDAELLGEVLQGGLEKTQEAGAALCGGHSVKDTEVKYGLAVTGIVHPDAFWRNSGAQLGDQLLLTKPLGMGAVSTGLKKALVAGDSEIATRAMQQMATLNRGAADALRAAGITVHAATDVTGFGLAGHGTEMANGAGLSLRIDLDAVPLFDGAVELVVQGAVSGGGKRARASLAEQVDLPDGSRVGDERLAMLFDAETSGGLLVTVPADEAAKAQQVLRDSDAPCSAIVGECVARGEHAVQVVG